MSEFLLSYKRIINFGTIPLLHAQWAQQGNFWKCLKKEAKKWISHVLSPVICDTCVCEHVCHPRDLQGSCNRYVIVQTTRKIPWKINMETEVSKREAYWGPAAHCLRKWGRLYKHQTLMDKVLYKKKSNIFGTDMAEPCVDQRKNRRESSKSGSGKNWGKAEEWSRGPKHKYQLVLIPDEIPAEFLTSLEKE